jgi:hypothetical protein
MMVCDRRMCEPSTAGTSRAVASIYSWGGVVGQKFPNISWHTKPRRCLLSGKWRHNLQTKIRIFYGQTYYRSMQCHRKPFLIGVGRDRGPKARGNFKFRVSEMPFPGLWGKFWKNSDSQKTAF